MTENNNDILESTNQKINCLSSRDLNIALNWLLSNSGLHIDKIWKDNNMLLTDTFSVASITEAWNLQEWSESNLAWLCWKLDDIFSTCTNWYFNNKSIA